jgi:hypothetical protein
MDLNCKDVSTEEMYISPEPYRLKYFSKKYLKHNKVPNPTVKLS